MVFITKTGSQDFLREAPESKKTHTRTVCTIEERRKLGERERERERERESVLGWGWGGVIQKAATTAGV